MVNSSTFTLGGSTGNGNWAGGGIVITEDVLPSAFLTADDIFDYYLIDPEMSPGMLTTRLLQPSLAIQQFVQQCFLNLTFSGISVGMTNSLWSEWSWRQQFRLWQANREVFLYPENYVLPETRTDASPFLPGFGRRPLSGQRRRRDGAETAMENYLRSLVWRRHGYWWQLLYNETKPDGTIVLYVFARTSKTPPDWFWRTRTTATTGIKKLERVAAAQARYYGSLHVIRGGLGPATVN